MYIRDYMYVIQCIAASSCWYIGCQEWKVRVGSHCFHARFGPLFIAGREVLQNIGSKLKIIFFVDDYIRWFNLSKVWGKNSLHQGAEMSQHLAYLDYTLAPGQSSW